jgi:hypothetical protein
MASYKLNKGVNAFFQASNIIASTGGFNASGVWLNNLSSGKTETTITYTAQSPATVIAWLRYNNGTNVSGWWANFYDGSWHNLTTNSYGKASISTNNIGTITVYSPSKSGYTGGGYNNVTVTWGSSYTRYINYTISASWHWNVYTSNGTFTAPVSTNYYVMCYGGGGGSSCVFGEINDCTYCGLAGGGGGYMNNNGGNPTYLTAGTSVPITIGGVSTFKNGGTTSFGTYISAQGGIVGLAYNWVDYYNYKTICANGGNGGSGGGAFIYLIKHWSYGYGPNYVYPNGINNYSIRGGTGNQFGNGGCIILVNGTNIVYRINSTNGINTAKLNEYSKGRGYSGGNVGGGGGYGGNGQPGEYVCYNANSYFLNCAKAGGGGGYGDGYYGSGVGVLYNCLNATSVANCIYPIINGGIITIRWYGV